MSALLLFGSSSEFLEKCILSCPAKLMKPSKLKAFFEGRCHQYFIYFSISRLKRTMKTTEYSLFGKSHNVCISSVSIGSGSASKIETELS